MYGINEIDSAGLAAELASNPDGVRLIDVRSPAEMAQGMIPGAEPMPLHLLPLRMQEIAGDPRRVVLYCRSGARSAQACMYLANQGLGGNVWNLRGGIIDWVRQGHPVERPADAHLAG